MKLPSRKELPDYYDVIKKPMDIKKIVTRIEESRYVDFEELERDFMQLCKNAQMYNEEASLIHEDSIVLQSVFTNARQRLSQEVESDDDEEDSKGGMDDGTTSDGDSSVKVKLKLKSGKGNGSRNSSNRRKRSKKFISDDEDDDIETVPL